MASPYAEWRALPAALHPYRQAVSVLGHAPLRWAHALVPERLWDAFWQGRESRHYSAPVKDALVAAAWAWVPSS